MISQISPHTREKEGETLRILEKVMEHKFFTSVQTVEIPYQEERKNFAKYIQANEIQYTYCLARVLNENGLNLSDLNQHNRSKSVSMVIQSFEEAIEAGAQSISLISGPRPSDPELRQEALVMLEQSLMEITIAASEISEIDSLDILIEPLDFASDKKNTLGTSDEALILCQSLKALNQDVYLCLDTAHMLLNDENITDSLHKLMAFTKEFHFCNCVIDDTHAVFGDLHIPFGEPGVLDEHSIGILMKAARDNGFFNQVNKPVIMCEVLNREGRNPEEVINETKIFLEKAWELSWNN